MRCVKPVSSTRTCSEPCGTGCLRGRDGRVLDFGCGWGADLPSLPRNCDAGDLVGVDLDPGCVESTSPRLLSGRGWPSFSRVLRVGGTVFFTTLKEAHIDAWDARRGEVAHGAALASVGFTAAGWRARAEAGQFLFVPTGGGGPRSPSFYGETVVPRAFLEREAPLLGFELLEFRSDDDLPQAFVALEKRPPTRG